MLKTKLKRDIKNNLSQYVTIFLMIFIGIFVYTGIKAYMVGMEKSAYDYYKKNNLQDFNAYGSFKEKDINTLKQIENVKDVNGILTLPDLAKVANKENNKVRVNYISDNTISKFYIVKGEKFDRSKTGIWVDSYYAKSNNLKVGDLLELHYGNSIIKQKIKGLINVPDKVIDLKDGTSIFPSYDDFGNVYLSIDRIPRRIVRNQLIKNMNLKSKEELYKVIPNFNYKDYIRYNKLIIDIDDTKKINKTKKDVKDFKRCEAIVDIKDELSYSSYKNEIDEGKSYIGIFSGLFIFIALISVITTMNRVIKKQRVEIGTLKALGFKKSTITKYYIINSFKLALYASILGLILGYFVMGTFFINLEMEYYQIPNYKAGFDISDIYVSLFTIFLITLFTYLSTRKILKLNAADTLRKERPKVKTRTLEITKGGVFEKLSFHTRWNIRDIIRNKMRTFMGLVGIIGCMILLVCAFGIKDTIKHYLKVQFNDLNNYIYRINIPDDILDEDLENVYKKYGKNTSRTLQVEINKDDKIISSNIFVTDANNYMRFLDEDNNFLKLKDGVYITRKLAKNHGYKIGDTIKWQIYGETKYYETKIIGFNRDPQNQNITMTRKYFESLKINYVPDSLYTNKDLSKVKKIKGILSFQSKEELKSGVNNMLETMNSMISLMGFSAILLAVIIIYNIGVLSFSEKNYQFATLKVLGFDFTKISKIFIQQNMWITIIAIIIGIPLGFTLINNLFTNAIGENYDFEISIRFISILIASLYTFVASYIVSKLLCLKIRKIDMVTSLKGNE